MSIALEDRDTKLVAGRELTKGNLLSALGKEKICRLSCLNYDRRRSCLDPVSRHAF